MADIIDFGTRRRIARKAARTHRRQEVAQELLADIAFVGHRVAIPGFFVAILATLLEAPPVACDVMLGISLTLWAGVILDACSPFATVGRIERALARWRDRRRGASERA